MSEHEGKPGHEAVSDTRKPYIQPQINRVDLALSETLSAGCKLDGDCNDPFDLVSEAGS